MTKCTERGRRKGQGRVKEEKTEKREEDRPSRVAPNIEQKYLPE